MPQSSWASPAGLTTSTALEPDPIPISHSRRNVSGHIGRTKTENRIWISLNTLQKPSNLLRRVLHEQLGRVYWLSCFRSLEVAAGDGSRGGGGGGGGLSHHFCFVGIWSSCQARDANCSHWFRVTSLRYSTLHFSFPLARGLQDLTKPSHFEEKERGRSMSSVVTKCQTTFVFLHPASNRTGEIKVSINTTMV